MHNHYQVANVKIKYLLFSNYLSLFSFAFFNPLFAIYVVDKGMQPEQVGLALGINMYVAALIILFIGKYQDRRKNKIIPIAIGYVLLAIASCSYIFVSNFSGLIVAQVINALGLGLYTPALRTTYALSEDKGKESREWSYFEGGGRFFMATGAIVGSLIFKFYGFKTMFILIALIQILAAYTVLRISNS